MKEATGEFSMTVVVILAVLVIIGVVTVLRKPITEYINNTFQSVAGDAKNQVNVK